MVDPQEDFQYFCCFDVCLMRLWHHIDCNFAIIVSKIDGHENNIKNYIKLIARRFWGAWKENLKKPFENVIHPFIVLNLNGWSSRRFSIFLLFQCMFNGFVTSYRLWFYDFSIENWVMVMRTTSKIASNWLLGDLGSLKRKSKQAIP